MEIIPNGQFLPPKLFAQILLVMRLTILFLTIGFLHVSAKSFSQEKITLNVKGVTLDEVFKEVTRQSGYYFWSGSGMAELNERVDVSVKDGSIKEVLDQCFRGLDLTYRISDKMIFVKKEDHAKTENDPVLVNGIDVKGKVMDENGEPLIGATISVKGEKIITATNDKGEFTLRGVDPNANVTISNIGYEPVVVHFGGRSSFNFTLKQKVGILDETQIIAYGTTTQRYSVGSISKVSSVDIESQPVENPLAALEGRVPGMVVTQSSGVPGASFSVQIRGNNAIGGASAGPVFPSSPLFIIDGVPFAPQNDNVNQFNSLATPISNSLFAPGLSPFNSINPADIESIEILRDADATSIYGSRGANGVVLITTKRGVSGRTKFNISVNTGESGADRTIQMMNTSEYLQMRHEALNNDGVQPSLSNGDYDLLLFDTTKYTNWRKEFFGGTAHTTDVNGNLTGGDQNTQFLIGSGYHHEDYIFPGGFSESRASVNMNIHHTSPNKKLFLDFSSNYSYDENNSAGQPSILQAFTIAPDRPDLIGGNGNLIWNYKGIDLGAVSTQLGNPLAFLKERYKATNYNLISSFQIGYRILPGLTVKSSFGYNTFGGKEYSEYPISAQDPAQNPVSSAAFGTNSYETWIIEPQAEYKKAIFNGRLNLLIGGTFQKNINELTSISASEYTNDNLLGSISAAGVTSASDGYNEDKYNAVFGRLNYVWNEKIIVTMAARRDGSSRFGPGRQFGNFGSVGAGWIFSQESLFKENLRAISFGKIRFSYGSSGSDDIGNYQYQPNWSPYYSSSSYQGIRGYYPANLANPDYSWAINRKLEGGLDLGFLKDRLLLDFDLYRNRCGNQLIPFQLPAQTGFPTVTQNSPALVQNSGIEMQINTLNIKYRNFEWRTSLNLTIPRNKLISYPGLATSPYATIYSIGQPLSVINAYRYVGVNDTTGVFEFATKKGEATYTPSISDFTNIGNLDPKFYGGFRNTFSYRGVQLDIFAQFVKQTGLNYMDAIYNSSLPGMFDYNVPEFIAGNHWQHPGDKKMFEQYTESYSTLAAQQVSAFVSSSGIYSNASFIRLKTISLSYQIPAKALVGIKIEAIRVYINAQNLFTISGYKGDPEAQNIYALPPLRTFVGGVQMTL